MKIFLAPMEGVVDSYMRDTLTHIGGYHHCVTEFIRITDQLLPGKVFRRICPELDNNGRTRAGVPVIVQLLGGDPAAMAANAIRAVELGAPGIDINFGCPSKFVNRKAGGAVLLKEPQRLSNIVDAVRRAVPKNIPVSAKIRLGYENTDLALDNAHAVEDAGADFITVHARTKADGYKAPARWEWLAYINEALEIPVIANGDINSIEDYRRCVDISGCDEIMIGRGAVAQPDLALQIKHYQHGKHVAAIDWTDIQTLLIQMMSRMQADVKERYIVARIKQWLSMLKRHYPEAVDYFQTLRTVTDFDALKTRLQHPPRCAA